MKLIDIKNIETLNIAQSQTVKGGGRETRPGSTVGISTVIYGGKK